MAEAHPFLSAEDEFADFETWDKASFGPNPKAKKMLPREYAREACKRGLAYDAKLGVNPFKFGVIGSTDSHTSLSTAQEDNFFGKVVVLEPSTDPNRFEEVIAGRPAPSGSAGPFPHHVPKKATVSCVANCPGNAGWRISTSLRPCGFRTKIALDTTIPARFYVDRRRATRATQLFEGPPRKPP